MVEQVGALETSIWLLWGCGTLSARELESFSSNSSAVLEIIDDPQDLQDLRLEIGVMADVGVHFVNATYYTYLQ